MNNSTLEINASPKLTTQKKINNHLEDKKNLMGAINNDISLKDLLEAGPSHVPSPVCEKSLEEIRPLAKAGERTSKTGGRKRRTTAMLTDTPIKDELELEKQQRKKKKTKQSKAGLKNVKRDICSKKTKAKEIDSSSEEDECFYLICLELFSNSVSKEKWVQCTKCKEWAHEACTAGDILFLCAITVCPMRISDCIFLQIYFN
ncbi:uncharacterized protein LOC126880040 [Diabrotica virgifera virgifera]|uniref:Uncharacterized protein n=1 Tax=Diabrotica virgifera virgifera TaxID=50390 RepID=A0ABM5JNU2_DIAVI|nr:uncharacterized protein LOC126880040 [Diabrotica virgifera virgifera]